MKSKKFGKQFFSVLLSAAMIAGVGTITASAAAQTSLTAVTAETAYENGFSFDIIDGKAILTEYSGQDEDIVIPDSVNGITVVAIGDSVFKNNKTVKTVEIPKHIQSIGTEAFRGCVNLTSVNIFKKKADGKKYRADELDLVYIGRLAFAGCTGLSNIIIPDSVVFIDTKAFYNDKESAASGKLIIGNSVSTIGDNAFAYSRTTKGKKITSITLGDSLRYIGQEAFSGKKTLSGGMVKLPSTVDYIGICAFAGTYGSGEKQKLYEEIVNFDGDIEAVINNAGDFASGNYDDYYMVSTKDNEAVSEYCTVDKMWQWNLSYNRPGQLASEKMYNIPTLSSTAIYTGESVKMTAQAGDVKSENGYYYRFKVTNAETGEVCYQKAGTSKNNSVTKSFKALNAGIYNVVIKAYSADNKDKPLSTVYRKLLVSDPLENLCDITKTEYDLNSDVKPTLASAGGVGSGSVSYAINVYRLSDDGNSVSYTKRANIDCDKLGDPVFKYEGESYGANKTPHFKLKYTGNYKVVISARDAFKRPVEKEFLITCSMLLGKKVQFTSDSLSSKQFDDTKESVYKLYVTKSGAKKSTLLNADYKFEAVTPQSAGTYTYTIKRIQNEKVYKVSYTVEVKDGISVSKDRVNFDNSNRKVKLKAAEIRLTDAQYSFRYKDPVTKEWHDIDNDGNKTSLDFNFDKRGTYKFQMIVTAKNGEKTQKTVNVESYSDSYISYDNKRVENDTVIPVGSKIIVCGSRVSHSDLNDTYSFSYRKKGSDKWKVISNPNNKTYVNYTLPDAGEYEFKSKIKTVYDDGSEGTIINYFTIKAE